MSKLRKKVDQFCVQQVFEKFIWFKLMKKKTDKKLKQWKIINNNLERPRGVTL